MACRRKARRKSQKSARVGEVGLAILPALFRYGPSRPGADYRRLAEPHGGPSETLLAELARKGGGYVAGSYPERDRIDFGSLLVPMYDGIEIEVKVAEGVGVWITVRRGDSTIELMAFAAPKTSGLWDEVRQEFADEVANAGGSSEEAQGPFGVELHARLHPGGEGRRGQLEPVRFLGVDGSRWFLRGMIRGPAARGPELARPFEDLFADVVVVRGDHPAPPGDLLEIRLPDDMRRALAEQIEQQAGDPAFPNPFDRGPEITETR